MENPSKLPSHTEQRKSGMNHQVPIVTTSFRTVERRDTPRRSPYLDFSIKKEIIRFKIKLELLNPDCPLGSNFTTLLTSHLISCFPNSGIDTKLVTSWSSKYPWIPERNGVPPGVSGPILLAEVRAEFNTAVTQINPETSSASSNQIPRCSSSQHSPDIIPGRPVEPDDVNADSRCSVLESGYSKILQILESVKSIQDIQLGKAATPAPRKSYPKTPTEVTSQLVQLRNQIRTQETIFISNRMQQKKRTQSENILPQSRSKNVKFEMDDDVQVVFQTFNGPNGVAGPSRSAKRFHPTGEGGSNLFSPSKS